MALTTDDLIGGLRKSRSHFLKHLDGLTNDQWTWKPYPECKSIAEGVAHLIADDRAALASLQSNAEPDYDAFQESERDPEKLLAILSDSHEKLVGYLQKTYSDAPLDTEISVWGSPMKLGMGIGYFSGEDFYHAGQVTFVRMATDPGWDYYATIYGG